MYELVITVGNRYNEKQILKIGSYESISSVTSKFNDTNELRESKEFKTLVDSFMNKHPKTTIVVLEKNNYIQSSKEKEYIPHRVIYASDKKVFDKLLLVPNKNDVVYMEWEVFWSSLRRGMVSKKIIPTYENQDEVNKINDKIRENDLEFNKCSNKFKYLLRQMPEWYRIAFNPGDSYFRKTVFPNFKRMIKDDLNVYYQLCEIVLKAFDKYVKIYKLQGHNDVKEMFGRYLSLQNSSKHKLKKQMILQKTDEFDNLVVVPNNEFVFNDEDIIDEFERVSDSDKIFDEDNTYRHSADYIRLKPFIDSKDIQSIKDYFELYYPIDMTKNELEEIQEIMKSAKHK